MRERLRLRVTSCLLGLVLSLAPSGSALAGFTETLHEGGVLVEGTFVMAWIDTRWDGSGSEAPLIDPIERYEPGGGYQGTIEARPSAEYLLWVTRLQFGILDQLSVGIGVPFALRTDVDPNLSWKPGDYQPGIGRAYSEADFWDWAASMGQSQPGSWTGNEGTLSDIVVGLRWRWTDVLDISPAVGFHSALSILGALPTGEPADPEEVAAAGTTLWDLHFQGDLAFHLAFEKRFDAELDGRLTLGLDVFYEVFFPRTRAAPVGTKHPLLLTQAPYVGDTYEVKPGDFSGFAFRADVVPYKGPVGKTWLTGDDAARAAALPPVLALWVQYSFVHLQQTDWRSELPAWDWEREKLWRPGYKNLVQVGLTLSLFRVGVPLQIYGIYQTATLIPGKNTRAADVLSIGLRIPLG